ncbi:TIGR02449 family protein [Candidatus Nitrosacidococcus sp. I8]|uniref:TIGR02449 family protein n=1 Tax=Candidatus Nitrosacidococcus sp. I8 TaxID=2942908 RepID=UPI00222636B8|nr:TIGR02449 family protein [Candidatus Nitrosacidococcus sp. I8]CAH9016226.1 hypothetical protein NURINAE_00204 [Candidatus Nitrosacidococcus sp. I8]
MARDATIEQLEQQVNELITLCNQLKGKNQILHDRVMELSLERTKLIKQTEFARNKVESMIARLRSMEQAL